MNRFFDEAFAELIKDEGTSYTNHPQDSGGPTKFGVTKNAWEKYVGHEVPNEVIRDLDLSEAKKFYFLEYWCALSCEKLVKRSVALCIFNTCVLYGHRAAAKIAQRSAYSVEHPLKFDGILGDRSIAALNCVNEEDFLKTYHGLILSRIAWIIEQYPKNEVFRKGWVNRADSLLALNEADEKDIS